jgi:hypothetical protein
MWTTLENGCGHRMIYIFSPKVSVAKEICGYAFSFTEVLIKREK